MKLTGERVTDGVLRREFELSVAGDRIPGCIWTPEGATGPRPLILIGHGGFQHKKAPNITAAATTYAQRLGFATVAIDAPGHGDRITPEEAQRAREALAEAGRRARAGDRPSRSERNPAAASAKAVAEWTATLDAVQELDEVGRDQPVGYWGVSMGTRFGVPFVAAEPRITCAIFGLFGVLPGLETHREAAQRIRIPVLFVFQWEDELLTRDQGFALFNAFGSSQKTMHINPGRHVEIPLHEREAWAAFWRRHMSR